MNRRKPRPVTSTSEAGSKVPAKSAGWIIELVVVLILSGIPFAFGKYFEFSQPDPYDGGAYAYSAWHVYQGARLGTEEIMSSQPATFLVNYLGVQLSGYNEIGAEMIQTLLQLSALGFMFYTIRTCFGRLAAQVSTALAAIYLSAPLIAKFGNVKEQYMITFMVAAACSLTLAAKQQKLWLWALGGAFAIWAYFFKPTGLSILLGTGIFLIAGLLLKRYTIIQAAYRMILTAGGALIGISPLHFFILSKGDPLGVTSSTAVLLAEIVLSAGIVLVLVCAGIRLWRQCHIGQHLRTVPAFYWKIGILLFAVSYLAGFLIVFLYPNSNSQDIKSYLTSTIFCGVPYVCCTNLDYVFERLWSSLGTSDFYITGSRQLRDFKQQAPMVLRYYRALILPIGFAVLSLCLGVIRNGACRFGRRGDYDNRDWAFWLLVTWWLADMGLIWISPRSYEQYYLPMCASSAMLTGYGIWRLMEKWNPKTSPAGRIGLFLGGIAVLFLIAPIFAGITYSPFSGERLPAGQRSRGYVQAWHDTRDYRQGRTIQPWEQIGDYIRSHSDPKDRIYVWGWFPGIYVKAQRISSAPKATDNNMHILDPYWLGGLVKEVLNAWIANPPRYIVDTRKREFPWNVPPLELWPQTAVPESLADSRWKLFLLNDAEAIRQYEAGYPSSVLTKQLNNPTEARRFETMKPLRDFVMRNYHIIQVYGQHVLFEQNRPDAVSQ